MTSPDPPRILLRIPCSPEYVSVARLTISAVASRMDFGIDDIDDLKLAVGEACANAIEHAAEGDIDIVCTMEPEQLVLSVKDCGIGFDPSAPRPQAGEEPPVGGLGLILIQALMDDVQIHSDPKGGTEVRMVKRFQK
jgi:serine/threonine-protein kinase RsbW